MTTRQITDGGLETDLIFHYGVELPAFASFPLVETDDGRRLLRHYYDAYAAIGRATGTGVLLDTATWRANRDWGAVLGHDAAALDRVNRRAVELVAEVASAWAGDGVEVRVDGAVGPRGDGYVPGAGMTPDEAAEYHRPQVASLAAAGADQVTALTLTDVGEAAGIALAGADVGITTAVSFTVETDGRLPGGTTLAEAVAAVDAVCAPAYVMVNCAHPDHVRAGLGAGDDLSRVEGLRVNASRASHAELDAMEELDEGDPVELGAEVRDLVAALPSLRVVGGCCGTDSRHVARMWGVAPPATGPATWQGIDVR